MGVIENQEIILWTAQCSVLFF